MRARLPTHMRVCRLSVCRANFAIWIGSACWLAAGSVPLALAQDLPIAIVPVAGVQVAGNLSIEDGKATITKSGTITAGDEPALVSLPHRGDLKICATTAVSLMTDSSVPVSHSASGDADGQDLTPGLMMTFDRGALEANFTTGKNSDLILTPDFRILISGPGTAQVQVRLGVRGDTCVDNRGPNAPYVTVSSVFGGGAYRVQPGQRVMFQHGSLHEVVDNEKESCGCPPPGSKFPNNDFPVAQSEGLAPLPTPPPNALAKGVQSAQATAQIGYDGSQSAIAGAAQAEPVAATPARKSPEKVGFFTRIGRFFKHLFGG
jgi:hypothetical protein